MVSVILFFLYATSIWNEICKSWWKEHLELLTRCVDEFIIFNSWFFFLSSFERIFQKLRYMEVLLIFNIQLFNFTFPIKMSLFYLFYIFKNSFLFILCWLCIYGFVYRVLQMLWSILFSLVKVWKKKFHKDFITEWQIYLKVNNQKN